MKWARIHKHRNGIKFATALVRGAGHLRQQWMIRSARSNRAKWQIVIDGDRPHDLPATLIQDMDFVVDR